MAGQEIHALTELSEEARNVTFEFRRYNGEVLGTFSMAQSNDPYTPEVRFGKVRVPNSTFFVYALGKDSHGAKFQRLLSKAFVPQRVSVVAPITVDLPVGQVTSYLFKVANTGPADSFRFVAMDDKNFVANVTPATATLANGASAVIRVDVRPPTGTAAGTLDTLTFTAESATQADARNFAVLESTVIAPPPAGDVTRDGRTDCDDLEMIRLSFGERVGQRAFNPLVDLDANGIVDARDLAAVARQMPAGIVCK